MARQDKTTQPPPLTRKRRLLALERAKDPAASEYQIARRAGYSHGTACAPTANGIVSDKYLDQMLKSGELPLKKIKSASISVLSQVMQDQEEPGSTRGSCAKVLLDFSAASQGDEGISGLDHLRHHQRRLRSAFTLLRWAVANPLRGVRLLEQIQDRLYHLDRQVESTLLREQAERSA